MVAVAWQRLQSVPQDRRPRDGPGRGGGHHRRCRGTETAEGRGSKFHTYIERNRAFIPNDGEYYRAGERICTGFVESTVNQVISRPFCKKQQRQWTKRGAHLLLQTRVKTLNQELDGRVPAVVPGSAAGGRAPGGLTPSFLMVSGHTCHRVSEGARGHG